VSAIDRILTSFEALTKLFTARSNASYLWRYSVEEVTETTFSGRRLSPLCPFDDVVSIPLAPGIAGAGIAPKVGSVALVAFLDGDPSLPRCVGWDQAVPTSITIDASTILRAGPSAAAVELAGGGAAVHRVGDAGTAGTLVFANTSVPPAPPSGFAITYTNPDGVTYVTTVTGLVAAVTVPPGPIPIATKATTGSGKVTSG
jgi:hypothetical protein